jgi:hypothetical protein
MEIMMQIKSELLASKLYLLEFPSTIAFLKTLAFGSSTLCLEMRLMENKVALLLNKLKKF